MPAAQTQDRGTYQFKHAALSTVWRTVATGDRWLRENDTHRSHPLPSGGRGQENLHRLAIGGYERTVATGKLAEKQSRPGRN